MFSTLLDILFIVFVGAIALCVLIFIFMYIILPIVIFVSSIITIFIDLAKKRRKRDILIQSESKELHSRYIDLTEEAYTKYGEYISEFANKELVNDDYDCLREIQRLLKGCVNNQKKLLFICKCLFNYYTPEEEEIIKLEESSFKEIYENVKKYQEKLRLFIVDKYELDHLDYEPYAKSISPENRKKFLASNEMKKILEYICPKEKEKIQELFVQDNSFMLSNEMAEKYYLTVIEIAKWLYDCKYDKMRTLFKMALVEKRKYYYDRENYEYDDEYYEYYYFENRDFMKYVTDITNYEKHTFDFSDMELKKVAMQMSGILIGQEGERAVLDELRFYTNTVKVLSNIRLELNGQSTEMDQIIIAPEGVYILEIKNIGALGSKFYIEIDKDGRWRKVYKDGKIENIDSISSQNARHVHSVETLINNELNTTFETHIDVHSIIVFANDKIDIHNHSTSRIFRKSEIMNYIKQKKIILKQEEIDSIVKTLLVASLEPKKYPVENINYVIDYYIHINNMMRHYEKYNVLFDIIEKNIDECNDSEIRDSIYLNGNNAISNEEKKTAIKRKYTYQDALLNTCSDYYKSWD